MIVKPLKICFSASVSKRIAFNPLLATTANFKKFTIWWRANANNVFVYFLKFAQAFQPTFIKGYFLSSRTAFCIYFVFPLSLTKNLCQHLNKTLNLFYVKDCFWPIIAFRTSPGSKQIFYIKDLFEITAQKYTPSDRYFVFVVAAII